MDKNKIGRTHYYCSDEKLKEYMNISAEDILNWLEEINEFLYKAMPRKNREIWQKFRKGEL